MDNTLEKVKSILFVVGAMDRLLRPDGLAMTLRRRPPEADKCQRRLNEK
jgi:hypothetical protein